MKELKEQKEMQQQLQQQQQQQLDPQLQPQLKYKAVLLEGWDPLELRAERLRTLESGIFC